MLFHNDLHWFVSCATSSEYYFNLGTTKLQKSLDIYKNVLTFYVKMSLLFRLKNVNAF